MSVDTINAEIYKQINKYAAVSYYLKYAWVNYKSILEYEASRVTAGCLEKCSCLARPANLSLWVGLGRLGGKIPCTRSCTIASSLYPAQAGSTYLSLFVLPMNIVLRYFFAVCPHPFFHLFLPSRLKRGERRMKGRTGPFFRFFILFLLLPHPSSSQAGPLFFPRYVIYPGSLHA